MGSPTDVFIFLDSASQVEVSIISNDDCNHAYEEAGGYGENPVTASMLCAGDQGKYWEYHDNLLDAPGSLDDGDLKTRARDLELDMAEYTILTPFPHTQYRELLERPG